MIAGDPPSAWESGWAFLLYASLVFVASMAALGLLKRSLQREHELKSEQQRRRWAEALHHLIQSVSMLRDERAIAEQLIDTLTNFIHYERALFYVEHELDLTLIASRGVPADQQEPLRHWPANHETTVARLRQTRQSELLGPEDAASLAVGGVAGHCLAIPALSGDGGFRLLLVWKPGEAIPRQQVDIAAAMTKQVSVALDNARLIKELENLATTDGLTRLYNRRHFMDRAETEFDRSRRYKRDMSVLLLDADHFKNINDSHGHEMGDRVLRILANACRQNLRQLDEIGRYGGEEFVMLLPETSVALAVETAERLRAAIEQLHIPSASGDIRLTASIGIATASEGTESVAALINDADRALYNAKRGGRNRVVAAAACNKKLA